MGSPAAQTAAGYRGRRLVCTAAVALLGSLAGASCGSGGASSGAPTPSATPARTAASPAGSSSAVESRLLVQQGLSIGLASNVLQSQVTVLTDALLGGSSCQGLTGGSGSSQALQKSTSGNVTTADVDVYYDTSCAQPYIETAAMLTTSTAGTIAITETATYLGPSGATLGVLQLTESAVFAGLGGPSASITVDGTGTFTPHDGAPAVSLGLECTIPSSSNQPPPFGCSGAVEQSFPALGVSLGSVTPITLTLTPVSGGSSDSYSVSFTGAQSTLESGAAGALSITSPSPTTFAIAGPGNAAGSDAVSGSAALYALFPPTPTSWTVTHSADATTFTLSVMSDTARTLTGGVTTAAGVSLAHLSLDHSGTGTITYASGSTSAVTNWTLGG